MKNQLEIRSLSDDPVHSIKDIRNYLAGQAVGISRDEALLEETLKVLFSLQNISDGNIPNDEFELAKLIRAEFASIKSDLNELYPENEELLLDPRAIHYVASRLLSIKKTAKNFDLVAGLYQAFIGNHVRGQEGQFFTPNVAVNFLVKAVDPQPNWKIIDTACGACSFLTEIYFHLSEHHPADKLKDFVNNNLFGIEKDAKLTRLAKIHLRLLTGVQARVFNGDSLLIQNSDLSEIEDGIFDLVITNPPFGAKIKSADEETSREYDLGYRWDYNSGRFYKTEKLSLNTPPQVLFMERNVRALRPGGILATVIPESLVSNKNYKYAVQHLLDSCHPIAVIGMPESLFKTSGKGGTHTKTCLMLLEKRTKKDTSSRKIFMADAKWCGHDSRGNVIPKNDLPTILRNFQVFQNGEFTGQNHLGYELESSKIEDFVLAPRYYDADIEETKVKLGSRASLRTIRDLVDLGILQIETGDEVGKLAYGTGDIPYIRTSDLTNWEIKIDAKHKVERAVYEKLKAKQDIQEGDLLMVKDGTYLIGTVAIITKHDVEIIYQSHIYKMRLKENDLGLTPYNLLALLASSFVQRQIKSKQLTQDIIDSLGKRVYDIELPIFDEKEILKDLHEQTLEIIKLKEGVKKSTTNTLQYINQALA